jgi:TonB family protein
MTGAFPRMLGAVAFCATIVALIAAAPAAAPSFGGITLGSTIAAASAAYPQATVSKVGAISILRWKRPEGGKLTAYTDANGSIWLIQFDGDPHEKGDVQIPCGGNFDLKSSHVNLNNAAAHLGCIPVRAAMSAYTLPDRSLLAASFFGPGDGALQTVTWSIYNNPASWASPAATPPAACTIAGQEAVVLKRAPLDIPASEVSKALAAGASPNMDVEVMLGPDGLVKHASMYRGSGSDEFDDAAIAAVQSSVYRPKRIHCTPTYGVYQFLFEVPH